ncbi:hypothetical protein PRIPAC_73093 [Pristionchus pacificus]|uniref:Uncharacterized protein n=1 Tax=Pristionchus pacificus TaxID=54126 RepID=A0A2A6C0R0_PRIPA|nr:hypothetical protein PRIPAC_73093 [Pristionchus pacificus]|eukprot:PDM71603.1 hypothetical protein PRIPAC_38010 [Pristionchus pacificus]
MSLNGLVKGEDRAGIVPRERLAGYAIKRQASTTAGSEADPTKLKCSNAIDPTYNWTYNGQAFAASVRFVCGKPKG